MADPIAKPGKAKSFAPKPVAAAAPEKAPAMQLGVPSQPVVAPVAMPQSASAAVAIPAASIAAPAPAPAVETAPPAPVTPPVAIDPNPITPAQAAPAPAAQPEGPTMIDTTSPMNAAQDTMNTARDAMTNATNEGTQRATAMMSDVNDRAKTAMEKGTKAIEEMVEFSKGNLEAVATSGRVVAKGAEEIAKYSAEYGRSAIEIANSNARRFAAVKSPAEFFQLQGEIAKASMDALVQEGSKFTENYMKLMGEVTQPISNRVAMAAEKVKSSTSM